MPRLPAPRPAPADRPREKLDRAGAHALGDNELLALVLGHGTARLNALAIADGVLASAGGLHQLTRMPPTLLARQPGVGVAQASRIRAAIELGRRTLTTQPMPRPTLSTAREMARHLLPAFGAHPVERFGVVLLDGRYRLLKTALLSIGSVDASIVHPREVFQEAVTIGAAGVIIFHNHPSGDPTPSPEDRHLTQRLQAAGTILGVPLVDHLVLADTRYYSFRETEGRR